MHLTVLVPTHLSRNAVSCKSDEPFEGCTLSTSRNCMSEGVLPIHRIFVALAGSWRTRLRIVLHCNINVGPSFVSFLQLRHRLSRNLPMPMNGCQISGHLASFCLPSKKSVSCSSGCAAHLSHVSNPQTANLQPVTVQPRGASPAENGRMLLVSQDQNHRIDLVNDHSLELADVRQWKCEGIF